MDIRPTVFFEILLLEQNEFFLRCLERRSEFRSIKRIENAVEERGFREPVGTVRREKERGAEHAIVFHAT